MGETRHIKRINSGSMEEKEYVRFLERKNEESKEVEGQNYQTNNRRDIAR